MEPPADFDSLRGDVGVRFCGLSWDVRYWRCLRLDRLPVGEWLDILVVCIYIWLWGGRVLEPIQDLPVRRIGRDFYVLQGKKPQEYLLYCKVF